MRGVNMGGMTTLVRPSWFPYAGPGAKSAPGYGTMTYVLHSSGATPRDPGRGRQDGPGGVSAPQRHPDSGSSEREADFS
ncbi:hypothetical protein HNQ79_001548 [Streptomyces candidus]|uniref:Uncharacterized protein n=1 Tax=Streptomyces candidus TaxID=67283 RepID=A0A7X0HF04_9ACTN|nr:hypothetical protein [Streptomyces candidus]